ncbi:MAG: bifunctional nuclease family protein [Thermoguttaceae bacterium]
MAVQVELSRIIICELNSEQVIFLREVGGTREFSIVIGIFEAMSIDRRVKGFQPQRPLTHDLIYSAIEALGGKLKDVFISHLEENTYFASLRVERGNELIEIDARPSDAIAVAFSVSPPAPIFIDDDVFKKIMLTQSGIF